MLGNLAKHFVDITVNRLATSDDAWGTKIGTPVYKGVVKGRLKELSSNQQYQSDVSMRTVMYRVYAEPCDVIVTDQLVLGTTKITVEAINDVMFFGRLLQMDCSKYVQ